MAVAPGRWCWRCRVDHTTRCPVAEAESRRQSDQLRGGASERGYDAQWSRFRLVYLASHVACADCGRIATEVHHRVKLRAGGARLDPANCMALCRVCHSVRTARGE